MRHIPRNKKIKIKVYSIIAAIIVAPIFSLFAFAQPANAQFGGITFDQNAFVQRPQIAGLEKKEATISESLLSAAMGSLLHGVSFFTRKLAYDTAQYVAYGGKGQGALAFQQGFGNYLEGVALDSTADAIGELGKPFGLNLCQIPDVRINILLQIGLRDLYANTTGPQPNCTWQDLRNGGIFDGDAWTQRYGSQEGLAETFSGTLSVSNNDFGIALGAIAQLNNIQAGASIAAREDRREGNGFKPLTELISGDIKTPAQVVQEETKVLTAKHNAELSAGQIAGIYGSGLKQIPALAASVFLNTLTSQLLNRLLTEGLFPSGSDGTQYSASSFDFFGAGNVNRTAAQNAFNFLFVVRPTPINNYPIVAEFAACPDIPGLNNCVIDSGLQQALSQAKAGEALTVQEAMDLGMLHPNWPLISPRHREHNINDCQNGKYCYSNLQKLRKVRVLPLGFEIAALRSDPDSPWTLQQVVENFDNCKYKEDGSGEIEVDTVNYPFCHLINPNWIVAIPSAKCEMNVNGPLLTTDNNANRRSECVDISTCLQKDEQGNCLNYGYCTKEQNIWDIDADSCPAYANTCDTYTDQNGVINSYLSRTLEFDQCSADDVGCRAYALEQINAENWVASPQISNSYRAVGRNQVVQFNAKVLGQSSVCDPDSDGCSAFFSATRLTDGTYALNDIDQYVREDNLDLLKYVQKAPEYLGCYDTNRAANSPETNWPKTRQEAENLVSNNALCDAYAPVCAPEEVGCSSYSPVNGGPSIPAKIGESNLCAAECVGYETFKQLGYTEVGQGFEQAEFPLYFIPANAQSAMQQQGLECNAAVVGCDEFTNLDSVQNGGEGLEYYTDLQLCELPRADNSNIEVYYSWEGSAIEGFVLRTHSAKRIDDEYLAFVNDALDGQAEELGYGLNSPAYANETTERLQEFAQTCKKSTYEQKIENPGDPNNIAPEDCHALYDQNDQVYYRVVSELKIVSDQCHALRKTDTDTYEDTSIGEASCEGRGNWNGNSCIRCSAGGIYENGVCIYETVSEVGSVGSCSPAANACRAYTGNAAGNTTRVAQFEFEPNGEGEDALNLAQEGWQGGDVRVVSEAPDVGLYSLLINGGQALVELTSSSYSGIQSNAFYEVSFVARGDSQNIRISLKQNDQEIGVFTENQSIGTTWNLYRVGPLEIGEIDLNQPLVLHIEANSQLFIDSLEMKRTQETLYLIKDSWKQANGNDVPLSCDINPADGLPGSALGCAAYQEEETKGLLRYATGFDELCRPEAVGCQPLWDTQNTITGPDHQNARVFNLWCAGNPTENCSLALATGFELGSCTIPQGEDGCYVRKNDSLEIVLPNAVVFETLQADLPNSAIDNSTIYIPQDTALEDPIFLAVTDEVTCRKEQLGCELVGLEEQSLPEDGAAISYDHQDVRVKNDPSTYNNILCSANKVGCSEYTDTSGASFYFKDPKINGNRICEYRQASNPGDPYGWFIADQQVGTCSNNINQLCNADEQCGGGQCINQGQVSCYEEYVRAGGERGIWSNSSDEYQGFVGSCAAQYNGCTELVDPADSSNINPNGKPYYVIENSRLAANDGECTQVSLVEGCVLFDKTDNPNKLFNSAQSYENSQFNAADPFALVDPVTEPTNGDRSTIDANLILKVRRDRQCSEWLQCTNYIPTLNFQTGEQEYKCASYRACEKFGETGNCVAWVDQGAEENIEETINLLDFERYTTRGIGWYDSEYTGYSLYNKYQITNLQQIGFNFEELENENDRRRLYEQEQQTYLARVLDEKLFRDLGAEELDCSYREGEESTDWNLCGIEGQGICYNQKCLYPLDGGFGFGVDSQNPNDIAKALAELQENSCKAYPEQDSPFPTSIIPPEGIEQRRNPDANNAARNIFTQSRSGYGNINVCQDGNCSCEYNKVIYKNGETDYVSFGGNVYTGICSSGEDAKIGAPCSEDNQCGEGDTAVCEKVKETQQVFGIRGFCLEEDYLHRSPIASNEYRCLTWLPVQTSVGRSDTLNSELAAGYLPRIDAEDAFGELYCTQANGYVPFNDIDDQNNIDSLSRLVNTGEVRPEDEFPPARIESCQIDNCNVGGGGQLGACAPTDFHDYACAAGDNGISGQGFSFLGGKNLFLSWAKKNLDISATILRTETPIETAQDIYGRFFNVHSNQQPFNPNSTPEAGAGCGSQAENGSPACTIHSFAPVGFGNVVDYGTVMHPPRIFDAFGDNGINKGEVIQCSFEACVDRRTNCQDANNQECWVPCNPNEVRDPGYNGSLVYLGPRRPDSCGFAYQSFNYVNDNNRKISTHPMSPDPHGTFSERLNEDVDDYLTTEGDYILVRENNAELNLLEDSINRIYFIPTGYPHGAEGYQPALMNTEMYIDFLELQKNGVGIDRVVPVSVNAGNNQYFARKSLNEQGGVIKSFLLKGNENISSYARYGEGELRNAQGWMTDLPQHIMERNVIESRYVMIFYKRPNDNVQDPFEDALGRIPNPFTARCKVGDLNWIAIGMDFNSNGEFLGYISRYCNGQNAAHNGIQFSVVATKNLECTALEQTFNQTQNPLQGNSNKAWTNRLWEGALTQHPLNTYATAPELRLQARQPFGSIPISSIGFNSGEELPVADSQHFFKNPAEDGIPYSCTNGDCILLKNDGKRFADYRYDRQVVEALKNKNRENAKSAIEQLFAKSFNIILINPETNRFEVAETGDDKSFEFGINAQNRGINLPQLYSLNPFTCADGIDACSAGEANSFSVGNRNGTLTDYNGDGRPDEDTDRDGQVDAIIERGGSYTAQLRFFAFADDNRMPVRKVTIDWDDGDYSNETAKGLYKNRKPVCEPDGSTDPSQIGLCVRNGNPTGMTCSAGRGCATGEQCLLGDEVRNLGEEYETKQFGNLPRACDQGYFEYLHEYVCDQSDIEAERNGVDLDHVQQVGSLSDSERLQNIYGLEPEDLVCVYRPRVQVMDNWGWCNGQCAKRFDVNGDPIVNSISDGCFDAVVPRPNIPGLTQNQCSITKSNLNNPWTEGTVPIIVLPPQ